MAQTSGGKISVCSSGLTWEVLSDDEDLITK